MSKIKIFCAVAALVGLLMSVPVLSRQAVQAQRTPRALSRQPYVSVVDFGASGHDNRWDSDAIQRAIDSLPRPTMPGLNHPSGGVVVLPAGRYLLNKPLRLLNGVTLRGEGAGTVLYTAGDEPAILLMTPFDHGFIASAAVEDLSIYTEKSDAIAVESNVTNIVQCRFENLIISPGRAAIDLDPTGREPRVYTQNTLIRNVHVLRFGGPALRIVGNANHIEQLNTEGGTRNGFKADPAIVCVSGEWNDIRSCIIEANKPNAAVGFHVSGLFTWSHNWVELDPTRDGVAYIFENVQLGQIDFLQHILPWHRARFINCEMIQIRGLNINGELTGLSENIELDEKSNVRIDAVIARTDAGMLDDPRISIGSVYNNIGKYRVDFPLTGASIKLLSTASRIDAGGWEARWDTGRGVIRGSITLEQDATAADKKLRVEVADNPGKLPLYVEVPLPENEELIGRKCIVTWRIDGKAQTVVYHNGAEFPSRVMNSLTANPLPAPLKRGDRLIFIFPPDPGVYFISGVAVYEP